MKSKKNEDQVLQQNTKKRKSGKKGKIFSAVIFLVGLLVFLYPVISRLYYRVEATKVVEDFTTGKSTINEEEMNRRFSLAKAYNASLNGTEEFHDPYVENIEEGVANYAHMLEYKEKIGVVRIPSIHCEEPIYAGTSEEVLQKGVGHMEFTSLPIGGENTHSVLTGHRGLPTAKIFSELNRVKEGDLFYVENIKEIIAYQVDQIKIIEPSVFDDLYIVDGMDYCTLLTCTPYMINSHRLLVRGHRVPYVPEDMEAQMQAGKAKALLIYGFIGGVILLIIIVFVIRWRKRNRKRVGGK